MNGTGAAGRMLDTSGTFAILNYRHAERLLVLCTAFVSDGLLAKKRM